MTASRRVPCGRPFVDCLEFRRFSLINPSSGDEAYLAHARRCHSCAQILREQERREQLLRTAFNVPPPVGLEARVLLRQSFARREWRRPVFVAAASVMLALTALVVGWRTIPAPSLADEVLAHIREEPAALGHTGLAPHEKVMSVVHALGAAIAGDVGKVRYAGVCEIDRRPGGHLVIDGERGPVTLLLLPGRIVADRTVLRAADYQGLLLPAGNGAVAIVGLDGEPLDPVVERLKLSFNG